MKSNPRGASSPSIEVAILQKTFQAKRLISRLACLLTLLCLIATLGLTIATIIAVTVPHWWLGDLLGHLRIHYGIGLLLCTIWFVSRRRWIGSLALIPALINLSVLLPLYSTRSPAISNPHTLQILHYNLDKNAPSHDQAFEYLREHSADILFLQEVTPELADKFTDELPNYRAVYIESLPNTHGSAFLLSTNTTLTVQSTDIIHLPETSPRPLITTTILWNNQPLTLLSFHVIRPKNAYTENIQAIEYDAAADWIATQRQNGIPMVVIGDCNTTPWSARLQNFLNMSGLRDSSTGFGYQPTWSAGFPIWLGLPIDHAFVSSEIEIHDRAIGPKLGGDHAPLWITIAVTNEQK